MWPSSQASLTSLHKACPPKPTQCALVSFPRKTKEEAEAERTKSTQKAAALRAEKDAKALQQVEKRKAAQVRPIPSRTPRPRNGLRVISSFPLSRFPAPLHSISTLILALALNRTSSLHPTPNRVCRHRQQKKPSLRPRLQRKRPNADTAPTGSSSSQCQTSRRPPRKSLRPW